MAAIDGKQIANMLYHAGVETVLTISGCGQRIWV